MNLEELNEKLKEIEYKRDETSQKLSDLLTSRSDLLQKIAAAKIQEARGKVRKNLWPLKYDKARYYPLTFNITLLNNNEVIFFADALKKLAHDIDNHSRINGSFGNSETDLSMAFIFSSKSHREGFLIALFNKFGGISDVSSYDFSEEMGS